MNGWFPRLNRAGEVVSGAGQIWCGGQVIAAGTKPRWLDDDTVVFLGPGDLLVAAGKDGSAPRVLTDAPPRNHVWGAAGGRWSVAGPREIAVEHDPVTGQRLVILEQGGNNDRAIFYGDLLIIEHAPVLEARAASGHVVWRQWPHPTRIMGWRGAGVEELVAIPGTWCGCPVPFMATGCWWLAWITNVDIRLRPWGGSLGYIIHTGEDRNFNLDAVGLDLDQVRLAWNDAAGVLYARDVDLNAPRVDVTQPLTAPGPIPEPTPQPQPEVMTVKLPDSVYDLFVAFNAAFPFPASDQACRDWMIRFAEQVEFNFTGWGYGNKRADPGRPISNDVLAQQHPQAGLIGWDLWVGAGAPGATMALRRVESIPLDGQVLVAAAAVNHLGATLPPPQPPQEPPQPDPVLVARVAALEADVKAMKERVETLARTDGEIAVSMAEQTEAAAALTATLAEVARRLDALDVEDQEVEFRTSATGWGPLAHSHTVKVRQ